MSNEKKSAPRRPDFKLEFGDMSVWDNRPEGGHINFQMSGRLKDAGERQQDDRLQEMTDKAREDRKGVQQEPTREDRRSTSREDRAPRDGGPRYER